MKKLDAKQIANYQRFAEERLGFKFHNINLLITALTHRSYFNEHRDRAVEHNERLEFLGDAVLELVVSDFLYRTYNEPEGIMTSWRSALVRTESIYEAGEELGYQPLVRLGAGEKHGSERAQRKIYADCFEAVVGATYLDQGYETAKRLIYQHIITHMERILAEGSWRDCKSHFQELAQHIDGDTPVYKVLTETGPDHDKTFTVAAYVCEQLKGTGVGHSQKEAQTAAAAEGVKAYEQAHPECIYKPKYQDPATP